ncbi:MAG: cadmium-translocating P-type ATPase [Verrucomicrobia bacterium]|jgi:Cd2+/Zn2+-exporting ATPase|nr:cadmium-translocating P-type ATPase [Verrucomicrobiota bacterium]
MIRTATETSDEHDASRCLARSVVKTLAEEPALEAVTIDRAQQKISVATLGRTDVTQLTGRLTEKFHHAQEAVSDQACGLLTGDGDCSRCDTPLSDQQSQRITIKHESGATTIARVTCPTAPTFWRWRDMPFPKVVQRDVEFLEHADEHENEWKAQLVLAILCGVFGLTGYFLGRAGHPTLSLVSFIAAYLAGGWFPAEEVWERLRKSAIDVHFLMLAVAIGAASIGAWAEGATLLFLFSLSGALEHYALGRTQKEIRSLFRDAPKVATILDAQGREREVKVELIRTGMRLLVKPGSQFPVDAEVLKGGTAADESNLTGEATPVEKAVGETVLAGTINLWGAVEVSVLRPAAESSLQKIIHLIREAQQQKAPAQQFTDKFGTYYTYAVLTLSLLMFFVWWLAIGLPPFTSSVELRSAFYRAMTLLVVASPCALVLSIPSAVLAAIAWGARHGVLIRGGAAVEKLAEVNVVALDKTGTLTTGELRVEKVESFPAGRENEVARLAYSLEKLSTHPLARAITRYGKQQQIEAIEFEKFESVTGQGLKGRCDGSESLLGRREWVELARPTQAIAQVPPTEAGFSEIWLAQDGLLGRIVLRDDIRPQARAVLDALHTAGLRSVVLTGDRRATAEYLKTELHLDEVRAELKPEEKVAAIKALSDGGNRVAMIGDGVNDAPSLAAAHVGVAMGARGSDAALEQADVVLMHDRLENFLAAFRLSQRARRVIRQNLVISMGTVAVLVVFALIGKIPLPIGVVGHEGSTVIVVMNSLRLLLGGRDKQN